MFSQFVIVKQLEFKFQTFPDFFLGVKSKVAWSSDVSAWYSYRTNRGKYLYREKVHYHFRKLSINSKLSCWKKEKIKVLLFKTTYPPASKASRELANLTVKKICIPPYMANAATQICTICRGYEISHTNFTSTLLQSWLTTAKAEVYLPLYFPD